MSDFYTRMQQIQFRLGIRPRPCWECLQRSARPLAGFKGPTCKGREGKGVSGGMGKLPSTFFLQIYAHASVEK